MNLLRIILIFSFLPAFLPVTASIAQNVDQGKKVFNRCIACHFADQDRNKVGPSLKNLMGRKAGSVEGYYYSPAMIEAGKDGLIWTKETLKQYLHNPRAMVPGTKMASIRINNDEDIDALIEYLNSVADSTPQNQ